jgi:hypothetical protein
VMRERHDRQQDECDRQKRRRLGVRVDRQIRSWPSAPQDPDCTAGAAEPASSSNASWVVFSEPDEIPLEKFNILHGYSGGPSRSRSARPWP